MSFSEQDLKKKGYKQLEDGSWARATSKGLELRSAPDKPEVSRIEIPGIVAGLNGSKGLIRSHYHTQKKQKDYYQMIVQDHLNQGKARKHTGPVEINYVGYKSRLMDWDNFCASFKHLGDSLHKCGVILDDNPKIVKKFLPEQFKSKQKDQRVIIIIKDLDVNI